MCGKQFFGEGSELDRNRYENRGGERCFRRKSLTFRCPPFLVAPQYTDNSSDEGLFVRQGHKFIVSWLLLTDAVCSIRYTGAKLKCYITDSEMKL